MTDEDETLGADAAAVDSAGSIAPDAASHVAHTPGPWWVDGYRVRHDKEANPNHRRGPAVCDCAMTHGLGDAALEDTANAYLIAAAPEMYEALKALTERLRLVTASQSYAAVFMSAYIHGVVYDGPNFESELKDAEGVIAKAEGR